MNEISLYVSIMEDKEVNQILKDLKQDNKIGNISYKKNKLINILREKQQIKGIKNPYLETLNKFVLEELNNLSDEEFINYISRENINITLAERFANLRIRFADKIDSYLEKMEKNIAQEIFLFEFNEANKKDLKQSLAIISIKEFKALTKKYSKHIELIELTEINENELKGVIEEKLTELLDGVSEEQIIKALFIYLDNNIFIDEEFEIIARSYIVNYLIKKEILKKEINKYTDKDIQNKEIIEKLKKEFKEKYLFVKKELKDADEKIYILEKEKERIEENCINQNEDFKMTKNLLEKKLDQKDKTIKQLEKKIDIFKEKSNNIQRYYDSLRINGEEKYLFTIIHTIDLQITKRLYDKEVRFISKDYWKESLNKETTKVYVQREGISSRELNKIAEKCNNLNLQWETIFICNERDMIEKITEIKMNKAK